MRRISQVILAMAMVLLVSANCFADVTRTVTIASTGATFANAYTRIDGAKIRIKDNSLDQLYVFTVTYLNRDAMDASKNPIDQKMYQIPAGSLAESSASSLINDIWAWLLTQPDFADAVVVVQE